MPSTFKLKEPTQLQNTEYPFGVRSKGVPVFECLRLLTGTLDIIQCNTSQHLKPRFCHLSQTGLRLNANSLDKICDKVFEGKFEKAELIEYLRRSAKINSEFWGELSSEICFCLSAHKKKSSVEAFLHLYRILELIVVAIPLTYTYEMKDFKKGLSFTKSLSQNDRDKDLSVLKYFSDHLWDNRNYKDLYIDYPYLEMDQTASTHLEKQLSSVVLDDKKIETRPIQTQTIGVSVEFRSVSVFINSCRNRLFHNSNSDKNFNLDFIGGAESLCFVLVGPTLYWLSLVISEIMIVEYTRHNVSKHF